MPVIPVRGTMWATKPVKPGTINGIILSGESSLAYSKSLLGMNITHLGQGFQWHFIPILVRFQSNLILLDPMLSQILFIFAITFAVFFKFILIFWLDFLSQSPSILILYLKKNLIRKNPLTHNFPVNQSSYEKIRY